MKSNSFPFPVATLDKFTRGYVDAALWSSTDGNDVPLDKNYSISDIEEGSMQRFVADCAKFQAENDADLDTLLTDFYIDRANQGHYFWLDRNRHGAGFQDPNNVGALGKRLADAARRFGEVHNYETEDGTVIFE